MQKGHILIILIITAIALTIGIGLVMAKGRGRQQQTAMQHPDGQAVAQTIAHLYKPKPQQKKAVAKKKATPTPPDYHIWGTVCDTTGTPLPDVIVSDGYQCVKTDSLGHYHLKRDSLARFVYYSVPDYCEVNTHSETDRTALFYQPLSTKQKEYNFTLTRLPGGKEQQYRMIVIGDPQVTTSENPFYTQPDDNPVKTTDLERFTSETMADIRQTIRQLPSGTPVYGLSMGDDVQYFGGYRDSLEMEIRGALGSSEMRLFSVIGNHDQDGKALYKRKWEEAWGPTDYSFDRGDEHYVCLNNVIFIRKGRSYFSPGELTETQMEWLRQNLALTPKDKKVILCYHIPLTFGISPYSKATPLGIATEEGHYASSRLTTLLQWLSEFEGGYELFCGHTHFALNHEIDHQGQHVMEHCHAAACGNIWQSNVNICGTPNGYYIYTFHNTRITDCVYKSTFWDKSRQLTLFRADTDLNGESYAADWSLPTGKQVLVANVFNADSRWKVVAVEDGKEYPMQRLSGKGQDAFATGYHHKYNKASSYHFISKQNAYLLMNHLYHYTPLTPEAHITVRATDPYGHTYTLSSQEAITEPFFNFAHYYKQ